MLTRVAPSAAIISQPKRNTTKQLPTTGKVVYADCRPFEVYIALDFKWYTVSKPLKHKVGQFFDRSAAVIAGGSLPAGKGLRQVPLDHIQEA